MTTGPVGQHSLVEVDGGSAILRARHGGQKPRFFQDSATTSASPQLRQARGRQRPAMLRHSVCLWFALCWLGRLEEYWEDDGHFVARPRKRQSAHRLDDALHDVAVRKRRALGGLVSQLREEFDRLGVGDTFLPRRNQGAPGRNRLNSAGFTNHEVEHDPTCES